MAEEEQDFSVGRTPDFVLKAKDKGTNRSNNRIGVAWKNKGGSISVQLDPFVTLNNTNGELLLTLFQKDKREE